MADTDITPEKEQLDPNAGLKERLAARIAEMQFAQKETFGPPEETPPFPIAADDVIPGPLDPFRAMGNLPWSIQQAITGVTGLAQDVYKNPEAYRDLAVKFFAETGEVIASAEMVQHSTTYERGAQMIEGIQAQKGRVTDAIASDIFGGLEETLANPRKALVEDPTLWAGPFGRIGKKLTRRFPEIAKRLSSGTMTVWETVEDITRTMGKEAAGILTGVSPDAYDIAWRAGKDGKNSAAYSALRAARRGDNRPEDIADVYLQVEDEIKKARGDEYLKDFAKLKLGKEGIDTEKMFLDMADELRDNWNLTITGDKKGNISIVPKEGFTGSIFTKGELKTVEGSIKNLVQAWIEGNDTIENIDMLKKMFGNMINSKRKNKPLTKLKGKLTDIIRLELEKKVDGYETLTAKYKRKSDLLDEISEAFKTGSTTAERVSSITKLIRDNPRHSNARRMMRLIDEEYGINIEAEIAGLEASSLVAKGLIGRGLGAGVVVGGLTKRLILLTLFPLTQPRVVSTLFGAMGITSKALEDVVSAAWKFANKHDLVLDGITYGDITGMMADGLNDTAIEVRKDELIEKERARIAASENAAAQRSTPTFAMPDAVKQPRQSFVGPGIPDSVAQQIGQ